MSRKSITVDAETKARHEDLKREDETWDEFENRLADALEALETQDADVNADCGQVPDDVLTEAHLSDIQTLTETAVEQALANATRR
ncbi:DUF7557 family protein [Haloarcula pellucida]|uniref:Uncharacterized protein n=1 Tax=Haloarcula pellucida TaxID=1427151 RepID=A0A830GR09_9EURY|nr:hypothetical protein [Halomicroarcula pellucida]MBX0350491.1 hypothetical protein [Halomicroarcula pellucida]GGO03558.1 hypothetical protein GCM10009030_39360 [Halomicroarcula pellucida]